MTNDLCIATHRTDPERPRPALDGLRLCHGHHTELERLIAELPAHHADLQRPHGPGGPKISTTSNPGLHIDETAADHRRHIAGILASWAALVAHERGHTPPTSTEPTITAPWLLRHVDWCAAHDFVTDMLQELRAATGKAIGITDIPARRVHLDEQCLTHADGERCEGTITLHVRGDDWYARCPVCRLDQDPTLYIRHIRAGQWITADGVIQLATLFGVTADGDVIRQWKHRGRIRGITGNVENLYESQSVLNYLDKRRSEREKIGA